MKHLRPFELYEYIKYENEIEPKTFEEMLKVLDKFNIPLDKWGTSVYKTPQHLWSELKEGECILFEKDGELHREVEFVGARIICKKNGKNYRLWEDKAIFKDGRVRVRPIPHSMAEKFKAGEDPKEALIRGMEEELGIKIDKKQFTFFNSDIIEDNSDYPGIKSSHRGYYYVVLLKDEQIKNEYIERQKDKDIYFVWREMKKKPLGYYPMPLGTDKVQLERYEIIQKLYRKY